MDSKEVIYFYTPGEFEGIGKKSNYDARFLQRVDSDFKLLFFRAFFLPMFVIFLLNFLHQSVFVKFLIFCTFFYFNFKTPKPRKKVKFENMIFGHRCCPNTIDKSEDKLIIENSLEALSYVINRGTGGIEIDVQLTKDKEVVIFHDVLSIDRLCVNPLEGGRKKFGKIFKKARVGNLTLKELKMCKFKGSEGGTIPTLEEFVLECLKFKKKRVKVMIEVKQFGNEKIMAEKLSKLYKKYPYLYENSFVASFNPLMLWYMRKTDSNVVTAMCSHRSIFTSFLLDNDELEEVQRMREKFLVKLIFKICFLFLDSFYYYISTSGLVLQFLGIQIVSLNKDVNEKLLRKFQRKGYKTICWTVNEKKEIERLRKLNVSVITDEPNG